jgi:hypothetical protein
MIKSPRLPERMCSHPGVCAKKSRVPSHEHEPALMSLLAVPLRSAFVLRQV